MTILIDGHNLIPRIRGMSLRDVDDEEQLIELLLRYCRVRRKRVEVYFDRAPAGLARNFSRGSVTVHFVTERSSADAAIRLKLVSMKAGARNASVVTSDNAIAALARQVGAKVISSDAFAEALLNMPIQTGTSAEPGLSADEVQRWLDEFNASRKSD